MITLHTFGAFMGTPDSSPFVIKAMVLLKMAGTPFREVAGNPFGAPHGLLPFINDAGAIVPDSTLIRLHLEAKYGVDLDAGLSAPDQAVAWAMEKMCEEHLYFAMLQSRWLDRANFKVGLGRHMFGAIPAPARPLVKALLKRMNRVRLKGHGLGRHAPETIARLAARDIDALASFLGDKPYLMGDAPCAADASVFGIVTAILTPPLASPLRTAMSGHPNLAAYRDRMTRRFFAGSGLA